MYLHDCTCLDLEMNFIIFSNAVDSPYNDIKKNEAYTQCSMKRISALYSMMTILSLLVAKIAKMPPNIENMYAMDGINRIIM